MSLIDDILRRDEFQSDPPVLVDVGASGSLHPDWAPFARYAVCVAFDADAREITYLSGEQTAYRKLYIYNALVSDTEAREVPFHLTRSPYCSSLLPPRTDKLADWAFGDLFDVERTVSLRSVTLPRVLEELGLRRVDWFKCDSQGIDLRLLRSLGEPMVRRVLVAELEPGIIDAYEGEDKLWQVLAFMGSQEFWLSDATLKGSQRISRAIAQAMPRLQRKNLPHFLKSSPGWAELCFMNACRGTVSCRDMLLAWVFATIKRQHGFALELARAGAAACHDPLFATMEAESRRRLRRPYLTLPLYVLAGLGKRGFRFR